MTTSKTTAATTDAPRVMPSKYKSWLIGYIKTYHPEAELLLEKDYVLAFATKLFTYSFIHLPTANYTLFELHSTKNSTLILTFPMPPTYIDFVTIMKILDVK